MGDAYELFLDTHAMKDVFDEGLQNVTTSKNFYRNKNSYTSRNFTLGKTSIYTILRFVRF